MATRVGIGFSQAADGPSAAQEAAEQAKVQLDQNQIDLALLFFSSHYNPAEIVPAIYKTLDQTKIIGCSTAGIILSQRIETRGIGIVAFNSENIKFETGLATHIHFQDPHLAGTTLANSCITSFGQEYRKLFVFFADGLLNNLSALTTGIQEQLGEAFPVIGAGSSDDFHLSKTFQCFQNQILSFGASAMILGGHTKFGVSCKHGWRPLGKPRIVTDAEGPVIKTIDGQKAISIYEEFFPEEAKTLKTNRFGAIAIRYPLGLRVGQQKNYLLRNVLNVLDDGSIVCQDTVAKDTRVHIMLGNKASCLEAAEQAAQEVKEQLKGQKPHFILIIESLFRHKLLGKAAAEEIRQIKNILGETTPLLGMYSLGEIFSLPSLGYPANESVQNSSILVLAIA